MKKLLLAATLLLCGASAFCQGLQWGPWVTETRENSLTILWVSEKPGMAWVELEDGTEVGVVTTGYQSISTGKSVCMALIDSSAAALGTPVEIQIRKKTFPGKVVKKRFYEKKYKR